MNSAQYYEFIRELRDINAKLDKVVSVLEGPRYYYYPHAPATPPPPPPPGWLPPNPIISCGPLGQEQELPFKENVDEALE